LARTTSCMDEFRAEAIGYRVVVYRTLSSIVD
jgi:hypothetical protein